VRRSTWPNIPPDELVERVEAWGERQGVTPKIIFEDEETADDRIAREATQLSIRRDKSVGAVELRH